MTPDPKDLTTAQLEAELERRKLEEHKPPPLVAKGGDRELHGRRLLFRHRPRSR